MPFDWQNLLAFFAARAIPGVESVDGGRYLRAMMIDGQPGAIELRQDAGSILLTMHGISTPNIFPVVQRCREMFDLDAPMQVQGCAARANAAKEPGRASTRRLVRLRTDGAGDTRATNIRQGSDDDRRARCGSVR
jgi:hypothetical protein